ncbi:hypothetical protein LQW54_002338 [Pestalotiopsis sp. IQ-011]
MGGNSFSTRDQRCLHTPRMPPNVYHRVRDDCHTALRQRFLAVASPIEAPAKKDFGDVDIFVAWDTEQDSSVDFESIGKLIGAPHSRLEGLLNPDAQYAVPWPENLDDPSDVPSSEPPRFCQIDLHICKTIEDFHWKLWYYSHGDLMPMTRNILWSYDLVINKRGLFLRIPELKNGAKKVFVTKEPSQVLCILGYDPMTPVYQQSFESVDDLFEHTSKSRLFRGFYGTELTDQDGQSMVTHMKARKREQKYRISKGIKSTLRTVEGVTAEWRVAAAAGLREIVILSDYSLGYRPSKTLQSIDGLYMMNEVKMFVEEACEVVGQAAWDRHCHNRFSGNAGSATSGSDELDSDTSEDEDEFRLPPQREGYHQTWYLGSDMNDL